MPLIAQKVRALLVQLGEACPHTRVELLTPLAEGADRVAAQVALDLGIPIIAALPLAPAEYRKDFATAASVAEFDAMLAKAIGSVVMEPPGAGDPRPECYVSVGAYLVEHCHLLIALWDGEPNKSRGGTAYVVESCLGKLPMKYVRAHRKLDPQDTGLVHHIVTPRKGTVLANALDTRWLVPGGSPNGDEQKGREALTKLLAPTDAFNKRALSVPGSSVYDAANALAMQAQRGARLALVALFALGFGAVVAFEAATEDFESAGVPFLVLVVAAYGLFWWVRSRGFDSRHLDYRSFAEALRVQNYWRLAGIRSSIAPHYMRYRLKESEWIRKAILAGDLHDDIGGAPDGGVALDRVIAEWVQGQVAWFDKAQARDQKRLRLITLIAGTLGLLSLGGAVAFIPMLLTGRYAGGMYELEQHQIALAIAVLAAGAGALHGYAEKRALDAQTKRYSRMRGIFQSAVSLLDRKDCGPEQVREVLHELGREALEENADWVMLHRDRPLEKPPGQV